MKDIMAMSKQLKEKRGDKGFTLMEMLIVVAIIAILVAIAIPVFTTQLNSSKVAADEANIRSGYSLASATVLTASPALTEDTTYGLNTDGTLQAGAPGTWKAQGANDTGVVIGSTSDLTWVVGSTPTYSYDVDSGVITITMPAPAAG